MKNDIRKTIELNGQPNFFFKTTTIAPSSTNQSEPEVDTWFREWDETQPDLSSIVELEKHDGECVFTLYLAFFLFIDLSFDVT